MNGKLEDVRFIGDITLENNYSVRMGVSIGDEFNFRGRISCMQVYDVALLPKQINSAKWKCRSFQRLFKGKIRKNRPRDEL